MSRPIIRALGIAAFLRVQPASTLFLPPDLAVYRALSMRANNGYSCFYINSVFDILYHKIAIIYHFLVKQLTA